MTNLRLVPPLAAPIDDEVIKEIARTDRRRAVALVAEKYRQRLFHHASYIVKNREEAFDVVQEVFIKAIRERRFFQPTFKMKAWLFRVTSNMCFNLVRNRRRRGIILDTMSKQESTAPDQLDQVFQGERQVAILASMEGLAEHHKEILMLRYYSDLSYAEIADVLEVALGTVMSRLSRAKARLTELLEADGLL